MQPKTKSTKILGPKQSYVELLDQAYELRQQEPREEGFPLRPSAAGHCARKLAYDLEDYLGIKKHNKEEIKPAVGRLFKLGNAVERESLYTFNDLKLIDPKAQLKYKQQVVSMVQLPRVGSHETRLIEGANDMVVYFKDHRGIGDVKSKGDKWSSSHKSKWDEDVETFDHYKSLVRIPAKTVGGDAWWADDLLRFLDEQTDAYFAHNFVQLNAYACTEFFKERKIDHGFIYRYNKNDSRHLEIRFRLSPELFEQTKEKWLNVWGKVAGNKGAEAVKREYSLGTMICGFCPHNKECWPDSDAKKEFFKNLPGTYSYPKPLTDFKDGAIIDSRVQKILRRKKILAEMRKAEEEAAQLLVENDVRRFRLSSGEVMEVKMLKSPRPHYEIRRVPK